MGATALEAAAATAANDGAAGPWGCAFANEAEPVFPELVLAAPRGFFGLPDFPTSSQPCMEEMEEDGEGGSMVAMGEVQGQHQLSEQLS